MPATKITKALVDSMDAPLKGNRIIFDSELSGFGVRITAKGAKSFILNYRTTDGLERRYTIGSTSIWNVGSARKEAEELKRRIRSEHFDPLKELEKRRTDVKMNELCDMFIKEHLPKKAAATQRDYKQLIDTYIRPKLKHEPVAELQFRQVNDLFSDITSQGKRTTANRAMSVLSKMFSEARKRGWASHNPTEGVEKNDETKRERFLDAGELDRLLTALATLEDQEAANIFRLILLTGARKTEVLAAKWSMFDLKIGTWTKPSAHTKQKKTHNVPLSAPARQLLSEILEAAGNDRSEYVFPAHFESTKEVTKHPKPYRVNVKNQWAKVLKAAKLEDLHIHDLRHSFASFLVSEGMSLPLIGRLLGHTQAQTTHRYAHLALDPLRAATERVGNIVSPKKASQSDEEPTAEIIPLKGGRE
ncbi:tyrosine-type recombinase/integrase [Rhizobium indicum]|uniref:tyrosine-type recombinase/integrase n=1 Tax=Rhizobium indicum TaxID=2583231 RepID=UPI001105AE36|nr:site-specific integrase [Rhizobium indicum]QKK28615.1 tyrosine-type recombinase/integrase [Rhizobium indicum]